MLKPILNENTDIIFIPLNPAEESSHQGHYFAANEVFWNSLKKSNLIKANLTKIGYVNKKGKNDFLIKIEDKFADLAIFKNSDKNYKYLVYSIHDLAPDVVLTKSTKVRITPKHIQDMLVLLKELKPKIAIIMHRRVRDEFLFSFTKNFLHPFDNTEFNKLSKLREKFLEINTQLKLDWGPCGKVISGLNTSFFCVPFPSTQNGTHEQNISYWNQFKNFIDIEIKKPPTIRENNTNKSEV